MDHEHEETDSINVVQSLLKSHHLRTTLYLKFKNMEDDIIRPLSLNQRNHFKGGVREKLKGV